MTVQVPLVVLVTTLAVSVGLAVLLLLATVAGRVLRFRRERRDARLSAVPRRHLYALATDGEREDFDALAALDDRSWRAIEPTLVALVGKLRGASRRSVVALLNRRGAVDGALRRARRRGPVRRARAAELLGVVGGPAAERVLIDLLSDRNAEVRAVATRALGHVASARSALPLAMRLASDRRDRLPAHLVAQALLRVGEPAVAPVRAVAQDHRPDVRAIAVQVLGLLGAVSAVDDLVAVLEGEWVLEVRSRAAGALGEIGSPRAVPALVRALDPVEPPAVRAAAAAALGRMGATDAAPVLARALADPEHWVAHDAAAALAELGRVGVDELRRLAAGVGSGTGARSAAAHAREALVSAGFEDVPPPAPGPRLRTMRVLGVGRDARVGRVAEGVVG